jgi:uncharacterized Zn-binding protein involved in type VI secretion
MTSEILHGGAIVTCAHGGPATPAAKSARVRVAGAPVVTIDDAYAISDCPFAPPLGDGPCVTGQWLTGASRVATEGRPVAVSAGASLCSPTGAPMIAVSAQSRVKAI